MYNILSPDGIPIHHTDTYPTILKAYRAFVNWKSNYIKQGYYSSTNYGKIHLLDLRDYCQFIEI